MDVYIVLDGDRLVDVSAKLQGAELIRANEAKRIADPSCPPGLAVYGAGSTANAERIAYDRMRIVNADVKDMD